MGCGGSKQGVAATGASVSYRRLLRTRSGAAKSEAKTSAAFADFAGQVAAPATAAAAAAVAAVVPDVKDIAVNVDVRMATVEEEKAEKPAPDESPGRFFSSRTDEEGGVDTCTGDAPPGPPEAKDNEKGDGCAGEGRAHGSVHKPEGEKMICSALSKLCDIDDASKPDVYGHGLRDEEDNFPPKRDAQLENLQRQLQQVAEQLACFEICSPEEGDNRASEEDVTHEEEGLDFQAEEDPRSIKEPVFEEEDQFGDAPEVFKEDFSNKIPVYDEDPYDLLEVPSIDCDFSTQGNAIASFLSFGKGETGDDQIEQVMYQKFAEVRRSKLYGSEGKKRGTHYQLRHSKIRKHRKRRTYKLVH